jgi:hypothetical protein
MICVNGFPTKISRLRRCAFQNSPAWRACCLIKEERGCAGSQPQHFKRNTRSNTSERLNCRSAAAGLRHSRAPFDDATLRNPFHLQNAWYGHRAAMSPPAYQRAERDFRPVVQDHTSRCAAGTRRGRRGAPSLPLKAHANIQQGTFNAQHSLRIESRHPLSVRR